MKLKKRFLLPLVGISTFLALFFPASAGASFSKSNLISDSVFDNSGTMNAAQIDAFLNTFPSSCISTNNSFSSPDVTGYNPSDGFKYGSNVSAGTVIAHASQAYDLNPQVLLSTLQKEQSLVSGTAGCYPNEPNPNWPSAGSPQNGKTFTCTINGNSQTCTYACTHGGGCINIAVGYDCPNYCATKSEGFSKQIIKATWSLKFSQQRSLGNYNWNIQKPGWDNSDDPATMYSGPMTQGTLKRCASCDATYYDGYTTIEGEAVHMDSGGTVALYRFTPFFHGNENFVSIFEGWFGPTTVDRTNDQVIVGDWDGDGQDSVGIKRGSMYYLDNNNDGVADWQFGFGDPTDKVIVGDWDGDGSDELGLKRGDHYYFSFDFNGTSEIYQAFGNPSDQVIVGDWDGDGRDSIGLKRGSSYYLDNNYDGQAEIYQGFGNPTDQAFVGDWDGDGRSEIGLKRGEWYYISFDYDGQAEKIFGYGSSGYKVIVGDWDGNGSDSIGLKNGEFYYLDNNFDGKTDIYTGMGVSTDKSFIGDWNDDNKDTIGIKRGGYFFLDNNNDGKADVYMFYKY